MLGELVAEADLVFGFSEELAHVAPGGVADDPGAGVVPGSESIGAFARALDPTGAREIGVKRNADGASTYDDGSVVHAPGHSIDTVGAGDAFVAGYLSGDVQGWSVEEKLTRANAWGL